MVTEELISTLLSDYIFFNFLHHYCRVNLLYLTYISLKKVNLKGEKGRKKTLSSMIRIKVVLFLSAKYCSQGVCLVIGQIACLMSLFSSSQYFIPTFRFVCTVPFHKSQNANPFTIIFPLTFLLFCLCTGCLNIPQQSPYLLSFPFRTQHDLHLSPHLPSFSLPPLTRHSSTHTFP